MAARNQAGTAGEFRIEPISEEYARDILDWRYPPPYDFYNPPIDAAPDIYVREFMRPELAFHAVLDRLDRFFGFFSLGLDGQVPGGNYDERALDIGLGMKPCFAGRGHGEPFFGSIMAFAERTRRPSQLRLTVADFNERAFALYRKFGFEKRSTFVDSHGIGYTILVRACR